MPPLSGGAVGVALALELAIEEPPEGIHPVAWLGTAIGPLDRAWDRPRLVGAAAALVVPLGAALVAGGLVAVTGRLDPGLGAVVAGLVLFSVTSLRMLVRIADDVIDASETDPDGAREAVGALVGRDPAALSAGQLRSGAVESAAENLGDGLVAPVLAFAILAWSLPLAAGAAVWVKAVNTGDSMLGYRDEPVGWGFARLDDAVMWLPARLAAGLIALCAARPGSLRRARQWAREPRSPNSGWPMATAATALDVRLEKPGEYVLNPAGDLPSPGRARRGTRLVRRAGLLCFAGGTVIAWLH